MPDNDLGPMPESTTQEPELVPGGVDAILDERADDNLARDLDPDHNPAVDDVLPDEIAEADDKSQAPAEGSDSGSASNEDSEADSPREVGDASGEPDAGQEAEDGSVEPPA